ncbi:MAG: YceI family protein [Actinobacteria bacterium]|nr:YceI family protein [Actinomycetota bacterium]MCL5447385.1 YceI family protein [Actinomycetota bacterium]
MTEATTRDYNGIKIPLSGTYDIDKVHTTVEFVARHLMITKVRGRFAKFDGVIVIADDPAASTVDVTIDASSISTGEDQRDGHLRSADFLEVDKYPEITYKGTSVEVNPDGAGVIHGALTIKGTTKPVDLQLEFEGAGNTPMGDYRAGFSATTEIDRELFGLTWNQVLEGGGVMVGKKIKLEINVEAIRQS